MTIEYDVSEQDHVNLYLYHAEHSPRAQKASWRWFCGYAVLLFAGVFWNAARNNFHAGAIFGGSFISFMLMLLSLLAYPKLYNRIYSRQIKKHISEGKNNDFIGHQKMTLKEDCIEGISPNTTAYTKYSAVEKIGCGYNCIFVYIGAIKAYIIPLSAFESDTLRDAFLALLTEKTGVAPTGLPPAPG